MPVGRVCVTVVCEEAFLGRHARNGYPSLPRFLLFDTVDTFDIAVLSFFRRISVSPSRAPSFADCCPTFGSPGFH